MFQPIQVFLGDNPVVVNGISDDRPHGTSKARSSELPGYHSTYSPALPYRRGPDDRPNDMARRMLVAKLVHEEMLKDREFGPRMMWIGRSARAKRANEMMIREAEDAREKRWLQRRRQLEKEDEHAWFKRRMPKAKGQEENEERSNGKDRGDRLAHRERYCCREHSDWSREVTMLEERAGNFVWGSSVRGVVVTAQRERKGKGEKGNRRKSEAFVEQWYQADRDTQLGFTRSGKKEGRSVKWETRRLGKF